MHPGVVGKTEHLHLSENMIHCIVPKMVCQNPIQAIGNGCSGQTSKSRYVTPGPAATRRFPIVAHWIHAIIAPSITSVARRREWVVVRHLHQLVQLPSPNAHVSAIEQREYERVGEQAAKRQRAIVAVDPDDAHKVRD